MTKILVLVRDLLLRSRIDAAAEALRIEVVYTSALDLARSRCAEFKPVIIFVDLSDPSFPAETTSVALSTMAPEARLIGFASHVDLKALKSARDAGFAKTLSRSEFVAQLPDLMKS